MHTRKLRPAEIADVRSHAEKNSAALVGGNAISKEPRRSWQKNRPVRMPRDSITFAIMGGLPKVVRSDRPGEPPRHVLPDDAVAELLIWLASKGFKPLPRRKAWWRFW